MVLLLRDPQKTEILAALSAIEGSIAAYHQNFQLCLIKIDSQIANFTNTTSFPPLSFSPHLTTPSKPTFDDLLRKLEISMSTSAVSKSKIGMATPAEQTPSLEPLLEDPALPSSDDLDEVVCCTIVSTAPFHHPSLLRQPNSHLRLPVYEPSRYFSPPWNITVRRDKFEEYASFPASRSFAPTPLHFPSLLPHRTIHHRLPESESECSSPSPISSSHVSSFSRSLKIVCIETILRIFYVLAMIPWTEEPPGSRFREFSTPLKSFFVDRAASDSACKNCFFNFGEHILSGNFFFELNFGQATMDWMLSCMISKQPRLGIGDCAYIRKAALISIHSIREASTSLGQHDILSFAGGVSLLSLIFTSCFQNKHTNFMCFSLVGGWNISCTKNIFSISWGWQVIESGEYVPYMKSLLDCLLSMEFRKLSTNFVDGSIDCVQWFLLDCYKIFHIHWFFLYLELVFFGEIVPMLLSLMGLV